MSKATFIEIIIIYSLNLTKIKYYNYLVYTKIINIRVYYLENFKFTINLLQFLKLKKLY